MTSAPRIYYLYAPLPAAGASLSALLADVARMGFTHVMLAAPAVDDPADAVLSGAPAAVAGDPASTDASLGSIAPIVPLVPTIAALRTAGLQLLLDIAPGAGPLETASAAESDAPPDPRRLGRAESAAASVQHDWPAQLQRWCAAGVAGFACRSLGLRPASFWQGLITTVRNTHPSALFIAWTPGCTPQQVARLDGAGFDATVASTPWWDGRSGWLAEELTRLARIAPPIGLADDPHALLAAGLHGDEDLAGAQRRSERLLAVAAACGQGLLMPAGFEHGLSGLRPTPVGERLNARAASAAPRFDLSTAVAQANGLSQALLRFAGGAQGSAPPLLLGRPGGPVTLLLRGAGTLGPVSATRDDTVLVAINADTQHPVQCDLEAVLGHLGGVQRHERLWPPAETAHGEAAGAAAGAPGPMPTPTSTPTPAPAPASAGVEHAAAAAVLQLPAGGVQVHTLRALPPVVHFVNRGKRSADAACRAPRVAIERITPDVDGARFVVKRTVGEQVDVEADVFMDGHDKLGVMLLWRPADLAGWQEVRMTPLGNDRWRARLPLRQVGRHLFAIQAWRDAFATYRDELQKKSAAGLDLTLELEEGRRMIAAAAAHAAANARDEVAALLSAVAARLAPPPAAVVPKGRGKRAAATAAVIATTTAAAAAAATAATAAGSAQQPPPPTMPAGLLATIPADAVAAVLADDTLRAMQQADDRPFAVQSEPAQAIDAERPAAGFSSWYELFPRSQSGDAARHGTFADVERRLPAIRDMGFDTLYFPPIHPIGRRNRKGRNNSLTPAADDPGSPYAIGADAGGHDAIHPELGSFADFRQLCRAARAHGLDIALDFAIQCSPDHPWIRAHPDWFAWRPDGSMRYAENPPKKYEDIVNVDFYAGGAMPSLWIALRDIVLFWVGEGVRTFRVDNPHTKPLPFWEWMIGDVRARHPDVIFLSEAFTRPKVMYRLAKVGFSQSYSYFTWRHTKQEFIDYMTELSTTAVRDFFRPHFFVNTPDINPVFLQRSGRPGFLIRAALATLLSGLWGMYSGFELCEATPVPGKEDYLDSEKYEIRAWDWRRPGNIIDEITVLNRIRRAHPALQSHLGITFCEASDDNMLCFLRHVRPAAGATTLGEDVLFVAINLDPFAAHETGFDLPLWRLGLPDHASVAVDDLVHGNRFALQGRQHRLRLDPGGLPYAVWRIAPQGELA